MDYLSGGELFESRWNFLVEMDYLRGGGLFEWKRIPGEKADPLNEKSYLNEDKGKE